MKTNTFALLKENNNTMTPHKHSAILTDLHNKRSSCLHHERTNSEIPSKPLCREHNVEHSLKWDASIQSLLTGLKEPRRTAENVGHQEKETF